MSPKMISTTLRASTWNATFLSNLCTAVCCGLAVWVNQQYGLLFFKSPVHWILILPAGLFASLPGCWLIYAAGVRGKLPVGYRAALAKMAT